MNETVEGNPQLRQLLKSARSWGVSPSVFAGRSLQSQTVYTYDKHGRMTSSTTTTEAEWTDDDRELALQLIVYESSLCGGCGHPLAETTDPANEFAYKAELPVRCHRCTTADRAGETYQDHPNPSALMIPIVLRERTNNEASV